MGIVFSVLTLFLVSFLNKLYIPKTDPYFQWARAPYFERENSIDVAFVGSSQIEWGISPNEIWQSFGIPSFNYSIPGIDLKNTYYLLEELITYQHPKVIVIDVYRLYDASQELVITNRISNVFPLSINKINMVKEIRPLDNFSKRLDYYFPLHLYHSKKLEVKDFSFGYENSEKGHFANFDRMNVAHSFNDINDTIPLSQDHIKMIERILSFSTRNKIDIIFIKTPNLKSSQEHLKNWNSIESFVKKRGYDFINFNETKIFNEAQLVYNEDIANDLNENGHLNHFGAEKVSLYLAKILKLKYELPDRKNDVNYKEFNESSISFLNNVKRIKNELNLAGNTLRPGDILKPSFILSSNNKVYQLKLQLDGNMVLSKNQTVLWSTSTFGKPIVKCEMQGDGNLVLYGQNETPYWSSNTFGNHAAFLILQDDGNLVIYSKENVPLWDSGTANK